MDSNRPRPAGPGDPGGDGPGDAPPPPGDLPASNRIGPYFVESVMGRDDVEVLCLARDTARDERYVTLRLLPLVMIRNAPAMDVLRDFAERAAAVRHPNLDEFLGLDRDPSRDDLVFLVSGYVTGRRLADLVAEAPEGLPVDDVLHWADQLADAIDHLHEHKLRHGAVNPHRVVIETSGRVRLTGATVWAETRRLFSELTGRVVGADPDYASPQQAAGIASAANDVYSLGATIYTALAGRPPHRPPAPDDAPPGEPAPIAGLSAQINMALLAALSRDPLARPATARDLVQALRGAPVRPVAAVRVAPAPPRPRRRLPVAPLLTVGVVVVAGAGIATWLRPLREAPATETAWLEPGPDSAARPAERSTSDPPDDIPTVGGEAGTSPAPVVPPVTEAEPEPEPAPTPVDLGPIERQVEMTAAEAGDLEFRTNPAVRDAIEEGRRRVEEARTLGDEGDTGEAARVYELAMSAYLQALARDTLAATVETLGDEVALRLAAVEVPAHPILIEVRDDVLSLDADGAAAFTAGELERAEEQWRAARMQINALERLAVPADAALSARAEWTRVFEARPDDVDAGLAGAIDALAASTRLADGLLVDGQFEQAEAAWRQATGDLRILLERHETALTSASGCAEAWRAAGGRAPTTWIDDTTVATARRDAEQLASGAQQAFGEARYDEACDRWSRAARRLDDATAAHAEAIETLLAGAEAARQAGAFDEALARLDLVAPFVDEATVRTARIATLVARVQARARPDTRDEARAALTALLAVDPEHPDAADLERRVDALFGPHHGDRRSNGLGRTFVYLAPGVFTMGSPADEPGRGPLETAHRVRLTRGTWMGATEVTRAEFAAFVDDTGHVTDAEREGWAFGLGPDGAWGRRDGLSWRDPGFEQDDDHPVVCVSHADAVAFCAWLSRREGRAYRLPTEAEWEYACRAGAGTAYAWGDAADDAEGFANVADFSAADRLTRVERFGFFDGHVFTSAAASFEPNDWGLHDMHGNVAEWCGDRYARLAAEETVDPTGPSGDASNDRAPRVLRGGSFAAPPAHCRSAHRDASAPDTRFATHGFRVVCEDAPGS